MIIQKKSHKASSDSIKSEDSDDFYSMVSSRSRQDEMITPRTFAFPRTNTMKDSDRSIKSRDKRASSIGEGIELNELFLIQKGG